MSSCSVNFKSFEQGTIGGAVFSIKFVARFVILTHYLELPLPPTVGNFEIKNAFYGKLPAASVGVWLFSPLEIPLKNDFFIRGFRTNGHKGVENAVFFSTYFLRLSNGGPFDLEHTTNKKRMRPASLAIENYHK